MTAVIEEMTERQELSIRRRSRTTGEPQPPPLTVPVPFGGPLLLVVATPLPRDPLVAPELPLVCDPVLSDPPPGPALRVTGAAGVTGATGRTTLPMLPPE